MRKLVFILSLFILSIHSIAQNPIPIIRTNGSTTPQDTYWKGLKAAAIPVCQHTPSLNGGLDSLGSICYVVDSQAIFYRDTNTVSHTHVWTKLATSSGLSGWLLTGNSGTTSGTNFLGTTDNQDLVFKRNNVVSGLLNNVLGNTSFGVNAFNLANSGFLNTAVGYHSLMANTSGNYNSFFGEVAGSQNTTGSENTGIGYDALLNSVGNSFNTAVGGEAGISLITGTGNTFVGFHANNKVDSIVDYSVALGFNANAGSHQFSISDSIINIKANLNGQVSGYVLTTNGTVATWQPIGTGVNIYNSDGFLTANRIVDGNVNARSLDFQHLDSFLIRDANYIADTAQDIFLVGHNSLTIELAEAENGIQLLNTGGINIITQSAAPIDLNSSGSINMEFGTTSPLLINSSAGTSGQFLKSQGGSLPPIWADGGGGGGSQGLQDVITNNPFLNQDNTIGVFSKNLILDSIGSFQLFGQGYQIALTDSLGQWFHYSTDGTTNNEISGQLADGTFDIFGIHSATVDNTVHIGNDGTDVFKSFTDGQGFQWLGNGVGGTSGEVDFNSNADINLQSASGADVTITAGQEFNVTSGEGQTFTSGDGENITFNPSGSFVDNSGNVIFNHSSDVVFNNTTYGHQLELLGGGDVNINSRNDAGVTINANGGGSLALLGNGGMSLTTGTGNDVTVMSGGGYAINTQGDFNQFNTFGEMLHSNTNGKMEIFSLNSQPIVLSPSVQTQLFGGVWLNETSFSTDNNISLGSNVILVSGTTTLTLPDIATTVSGSVAAAFIIRNTDAINTVTITGDANIEGVGSYLLLAGKSIRLISDGTQWWIISN